MLDRVKSQNISQYNQRLFFSSHFVYGSVQMVQLKAIVLIWLIDRYTLHEFVFGSKKNEQIPKTKNHIKALAHQNK